MEYQKALEMSKEEFKKMQEFQEILLNINDENIGDVQHFIVSNFDLNNHSSVQKLCHMLGSIASVRPKQLIFIHDLYNNFKAQINSVLNKNELRFYQIFKIMKSFEQPKQENEQENNQNNSFLDNAKLNSYIENDDLDSFQSFLSQTNTKANATIVQNRFYSSKPINQIEIIEYAVLCGSLNIFKFLLNQIQKFPSDLKNFAASGGNYEIIHIIEQSKSNFKYSDNNLKSFSFDQETLEMAIEFHSNDVAEYLIDSCELEFNSSCLKSSIISNNFFFINKYIKDEALYNIFYTKYFNYFIDHSQNDLISQNIPFIEFAVKTKNEPLENIKDCFLLCFTYLNYDSVIQELIKYKEEIMLNQSIDKAFMLSLSNNSFDAITIYFKFLNEKGCKNELLQNYFNFISTTGNELIEVFLDFDSVSLNGLNNPLIPLIRNENIDLLKKTLRCKRIDVNETFPEIGFNSLFYAYIKGSPVVFKCILSDDRVDVNIKKEPDGQSVLHLACSDGNFEFIKLLLELKKDVIDVNIKNKLNQTPLHLAAISNNIDIVEYLVKFGKADIKMKDNSGVFIYIFY